MRPTHATLRFLNLTRARRIACALLMFAAPSFAASPLVVGSKRFTESFILGELLSQSAPGEVRHDEGLGNTAILLAALKSGAIDAYPEYTGTIKFEVLRGRDGHDRLETINEALSSQGLAAGYPLGFSDGYGLAVSERADPSLQNISDLATHAGLRIGLSHEFLGRSDGWPAVSRTYHLPQTPVGLDHGLAYAALKANSVDVIDIYTTDARIVSDHLRVLKDDREAFPRYDAVILYRLAAKAAHPEVFDRWSRLSGTIDETTMRQMNAAVELDHQRESAVAGAFLEHRLASPREHDSTASRWLGLLFAKDLGPLCLQHLMLVAAAVAIACALGIPAGMLAQRYRAAAQSILTTAGLLQTIPSLALLALLIPLLGRIGTWPALVALTLYALLPIVANTIAGLNEVPAGQRQAATALGLSAYQRLVHVELPLSAPVILTGIKTATVVSVGTATLAALIGAGGLGQRIVKGLALNDDGLLIAGAVPAGVLALIAELALQAWIRRASRHLN